MGGDAHIDDKEKQRAALLEEAASIVAAASAQGRVLNPEEDSQVLKLMSQVRALEEEIHCLARHRESQRHDKG